MPNKNSIESEIEDILNGLSIGTKQENEPPYLVDNHPTAIVFVNGKNKAHTKLKNLIQREVKKGRVEELKKLNQNLIKSGVEEKAEERIMLVIDDRLEELG